MYKTILVDSREKKPLTFSKYRTRVAKLEIGDYTLFGKKSIVAVEYKTMPDFLLWISARDRKRFYSQLKKLKSIKNKLIVVGGKMSSRSKWCYNYNFTHVLKAVAFICCHDIPIVFAESRANASKLIVEFLERAK
jgi:ERCC4-type nuclease